MRNDPNAPTGYSLLWQVFTEALSRCQNDKGKERHAQDGEDLMDQPMMEIQRKLKGVGAGFTLGQAMKKITESTGMEWSRARVEILDAMVYLGCRVLYGDEVERKNVPKR